MAKPEPPKEEKKPDPQIASKEKKQAMLKKQVLMKKLQAVRAGAGSDITSSYEPEGENVEEKATYGGTRVYYSDEARKRAQERDAQRAENEAGRRERAAAKRRKDRNQLRKQGQFGASGKYYVTKNMEKESVEMKDSKFIPEMSEDDYEAKAREAANESERRRKQKDNAARVRRSEMGAARRRENRNYLRSIGKYKGPMEGVEMKPEDKTPEGMGDITFDAGGAIPTTIKAIGDPRELETAMKLKKTQLRASGLNMSHEPEGDMVEAKVDKGMIFGKDAARNERRFGTKGKFDPQGSGPRGQDISQRAKLAVQRKKEHEARRGVKTKGMSEEALWSQFEEQYVVTQSDKTGNTKAYQDMKAGKKNQITGKPLYKKADHMNENLVTISNINVKPSHFKAERDLIKDILNKESREYSHNPEKYHDSQGRDKKLEADKPYRQRSRAARMRDPERGINSPAFKKFMADRGM